MSANDPTRRPGHPGDDPAVNRLEVRVAALEAALGLGGTMPGAPGAPVGEIRARRLVVTDPSGTPRLVAEVAGTTVELRLSAGDADHAAGTAVVVHAGTDRPPTEGGLGLGPLVGLQLWAGGDAVCAVDAWPDADGRWHPHADLGGEP